MSDPPPLSPVKLAELADRAFDRALAALRGGDTAACLAWVDHVVSLRALQQTREVEVIARMELVLLDGGGP